MNKIPGVEVTTGARGRQIIFKDDLPSNTFVTLLESMMNDGIEFAFYDATYPSPSDPGAYFSYSPMNGVWRMTLGNHGWSGGIYMVEAAVVSTQLRSLYSKGALDPLDLEKVCFFSHYEPEPQSKNEAMNRKLRELHS